MSWVLTFVARIYCDLWNMNNDDIKYQASCDPRMDVVQFLEDLPNLVLERLVEFLDYESRNTCRLVSRTLKCLVDDIGLSVRIDTREPGNQDFCQQVAVAEAHIVYMKSVELSLKSFETWKTLIISGPLMSTWFSSAYQRSCSNLRVLIINGSGLVSQDFAGSADTPPWIFDHLTLIEMSLSSNSMTQAVSQADALLNQEFTLKSYKKMDTRIQKNMAYLMQNIRSRVLKVFKSFVFVNIIQKDIQRKVRWEHEPLFEFLQFHRHTLEEIHVPGLFSGEANLDVKQYQVPQKLKSFQMCAGISDKLLKYWENVLLSQKSLVNLALSKVKIPGTELLLLLKSTLSNNVRTLTYICLSFSGPVENLTLDMATFQFCERLQSLIVAMEASSKVTVVNLNQVPRTHLTSLSLSGEVSIGPDFDGIQFMVGLLPSSLRLTDISTTGLFGDLKYTLRFVKLVLRCRTLNTLCIGLSLDSVILSKPWANVRPGQAEEIGLLMWLANLEASDTPNHRCVQLDISDIRDRPATEIEKLNVSGEEEEEDEEDEEEELTYIESEAAVNLDYIHLTSRFEVVETREQPFNVPRNADSYTIWKNRKTKAYCVQANTQPYTMRIDDIEGRVRVTIVFVLDSTNGNTEFKPLDIHHFAGDDKFYKMIDNKKHFHGDHF